MQLTFEQPHFEFIGVVFVLWIAFLFLRGILRAMTRGRSAEFGTEARYIAVVEIEVPERYYKYMVSAKMDAIRATEDKISRIEKYKKTSWPRKLALVIYSEFHQDCEQSEGGNPMEKNLLEQRLRIPSHIIALEVNRNASEVLVGAS